ncbi:MAG: Nif3-like dinuclear metal center hexameric protein [Heliobacteriaceae bacterium]|jgi:dinuclear metal center YbgI/SA1388 family protein|nr:Nif3-like dinuclear metal center hexameric protein [Heliobacteriaceae bacterium]
MGEIVGIIEAFAPKELAEAWDFCGFAVDVAREVKKIMLALTVTDDVVRQARDAGADMIISHHSLFFVPFDYKDMVIYCAHTNLDRTQGGTTDALIKACHCEALAEAIQPASFVRYVKLEISVNDFIQKLKTISNNIRLVNNKNVSTLRKIAFCSGSGSDFIEEAAANGADAFVTGDVKFHTALESEIVLFDIGHFESEVPVLKVLAGLLPREIEVIFAQERSPFENISTINHQL